MGDIDLEAIRADLEYASSGIDGADMQYNPHALHAMRAAEKLLDEVEALRSQLAEVGGAGIDARLQELAAENFELGVYLASSRKERDELRQHILDIDAHATPYGDIPDEPGWVGTYLLTAGALHRALGKIGHSAPKCQAEAELAEAKHSIKAHSEELASRHKEINDLRAELVTAHQERDEARQRCDGWKELADQLAAAIAQTSAVVQAAKAWRDSEYSLREEHALKDAVDGLGGPVRRSEEDERCGFCGSTGGYCKGTSHDELADVVARLDLNRQTPPIKATTVRTPSLDVVTLDQPRLTARPADEAAAMGEAVEVARRLTERFAGELSAVNAENAVLRAQRDEVLRIHHEYEGWCVFCIRDCTCPEDTAVGNCTCGTSLQWPCPTAAIFANSGAGQAGEEVTDRG